MSDNIQIEVRGLDKILSNLEKFPGQIQKYISQAGKESSDRVILPTQGLKKYPGTTAANAPPVPYYVRGKGTQTASGNLGNSERLGTQFYSEAAGLNTKIGNRASYAKYVVGEGQARFMGPKGWRKLFDVAKEKQAGIKKVYQTWVDKCIRDLGL
jgi:hypothetical protein